MLDNNLIVISEGDFHMLKYLRANGVSPKSFVTNCAKFRELKPYISNDDTLLVIIKGFTDFTMLDVYALMNDIETVKSKIKRVVVMSNVDLGNVKFEYYRYDGDLFYGSVKHIIGGKEVDTSKTADGSEGTLVKKKKKKKKNGADIKSVNSVVNPVMESFKEFNDMKIKVSYYGVQPRTNENYYSDKLDRNRIVEVDLFKNKDSVETSVT